jgi:hypothetical protein
MEVRRGSSVEWASGLQCPLSCGHPPAIESMPPRMAAWQAGGSLHSWRIVARRRARMAAGFGVSGAVYGMLMQGAQRDEAPAWEVEG